ncbi:MAG: ABC transporter ATP-binding protein [Anaerolineaceae bacterium]|nr:ABC transporter ATP-binding protein [Anaerolineaceae bacterium]
MMMGGGPGALMNRETIKPRKIGATLERLWRYFSRYAFAMIGVLILILGVAYVSTETPELAGQAVDCFLTPATTLIFAGQGNVPTGLLNTTISAAATDCWFNKLSANATTNDYIQGLGGLILVVVGLYIAGALMNGLVAYLMNWTGQHVLKTLRVEVFHHVHELSIGYYAVNEAGSVMSRITNDMDTIQQTINFVLVNLLSGVVLIIWVTIKMFTVSVPYALISMVVVPFMVVTTLWLSAQARKAFRATRLEIGKVNANLEESIAGVREVQAFGREDVNIESFRSSNASYRDANVRAVSYTAALQPTLEALGYIAIAIVTISGGFLLLRGQQLFGVVVSLGLIITFIGYVQRFNQPISMISQLWANLQSAVAGAERIFDLLDTVPDLQDKPNAPEMAPIKGRVEFDHVSASYLPGEMVLCDVSFKAEPGQTIALVGQTGAGKTTIINLIPRFYDVASGKIMIDDVNVADVTSASLRKQIGIVLQDTYLFSDTVMNNIRFGRPDATDQEVFAAAQLSHADDFIQRLPDGYKTVLGEHGAGLSQGQRQLLSIARAALANPRILILDEATSSVDTRTERLIQHALEKLLEGRTSFVVAHRLSTIRNADQVLVIDDGQIVERGTHASLLEAKGVYYNLYMRQFRQDASVKADTSADGNENGSGNGNGNGHAKEFKPDLAGGI